MSGPQAFFTAGHTRYIRVSAHGFEPGYRWEKLTERNFERDSPIAIKVQPFLNNHGGGVVLEYRPEEDRYFLTLRMVDGPLAGRIETIKVMRSRFLKVSVGQKLYLKTDLEALRREDKVRKVLAHSVDSVFREGFPEEPYIQATDSAPPSNPLP
jgi:hypothetical protein